MPTMISVDLMTAVTRSPSRRPSASAESRVMAATSVCPPMSMVTSAMNGAEPDGRDTAGELVAGAQAHGALPEVGAAFKATPPATVAGGEVHVTLLSMVRS